MAEMAECPQCGSDKVVKDGKRYDYERPVQRFLCLYCGLRFNDNSLKPDEKGNVRTQLVEVPESEANHFKKRVVGADFPVKEVSDSVSLGFGEDVRLHKVTNRGKSLYLLRPCSSNHRVGEIPNGDSKNLETTANVQNVAGETNNRDIKGSLTLFAAKQLTAGLNEATIKRRLQNLEAIQRIGGDLNDPLSVWKAIDRATRRDMGETVQPWTEGSKRLAAQAYTAFAKTLHITLPEELNFGKWKVRQKLPWLPLTGEVDQLVAGCRLKMATFLEMLKQTGARSGELWRLTWKDVDLEHGTVTLNSPEKNGLPRQLKIDGKLISMLNRFPKTGEKLWNGNIQTWRSSFVAQRTRIANKLGNPRLKSIHFHTLRHLFASLLYQKTLCLVEVQEKLGHRNITSTALYTHLIKFEGDEYNHAIAKTVEEAGKLVDAGFDYVCDYGTEGKLFRKRK